MRDRSRPRRPRRKRSATAARRLAEHGSGTPLDVSHATTKLFLGLDSWHTLHAGDRGTCTLSLRFRRAPFEQRFADLSATDSVDAVVKRTAPLVMSHCSEVMLPCPFVWLCGTRIHAALRIRRRCSSGSAASPLVCGAQPSDVHRWGQDFLVGFKSGLDQGCLQSCSRAHK